MKYVAADLGSSYLKFAIIDTDTLTITHKQVIPALPRRGHGYQFEIDSEALWQTVKTGIDKQLETAGEESCGILLSTQMHGFVLANRQGRGITDYISWQDMDCMESVQGSTPYKKLEELIDMEYMKNSGIPLKPRLAMCNLFSRLQKGLVLQENTLFCTLGSFIINKLTGKNACHITNAAPTGLADISMRSWNRSLISKIGCEKLEFPELVEDYTPVGYYKSTIGMIPVFPDYGDHQLSVLGSMSKPETDINVSMGTAGLLGMVTKEYTCGEYETRPFFEKHYLKTLSGLPAGREMNVIVEFIRDGVKNVTGAKPLAEDVWLAVHREMSLGGCEDLSVDLNFYSGGGMIGRITPEAFSFSVLIRSMMKKTALCYKQGIEKINAEVGPKRMVFSGGYALKTPEIVAEMERVVGLPAAASPFADEVFMGLLRIALVISGICKSLNQTRGICVTIIH